MTDELPALLDRLGAPAILVAGDLMVDRYLRGEVRRISPEAPIPVFEEAEEERRLGGAANVAANLAALGAKPILVGLAGADAEGDFLVAEAGRRGIDASGVVRDRGRPTTLKTRLVSAERQVLRLDRERRHPPGRAALSRLRDAAVKGLAHASLLLVSDYAKGALPPALLAVLWSEARSRGREAIVDPKGTDLSRYRGAFGLKCNRAEAFALAGREPGGIPALEAAGAALLASGGFAALLVTRREGIAIFEPSAPPRHVPGQAVAVYDVSGAGDTVHAAVGIGRASGLSWEACARLANAAAGVAVGRPGAVAVAREEIREAHRSRAGSAGKVLAAEALARALDLHRARREPVVFTNGCFDLLHPGHLATLRFAKAQGRVLVVAVNSDASVRRLKGEGRPVLPAPERAGMLAALADVDYVTVFEEETPESLIRLLKPDVLVKGADWKGKGVVGQRFVESCGGRVALAPIVPGISTSAILEKVREGRRK